MYLISSQGSSFKCSSKYLHYWEKLLFENRIEIIEINNYVICIDTRYNYIGEWNDTSCYNILYYFSFKTQEYVNGVERVSKIQYFSKNVNDFLLPHTTIKQKTEEDTKNIRINFEQQEVSLSINRKNYVSKYYDDLNENSFIECKFQDTKNWEYTYNLCIVIEQYLKITLYIKNMVFPTIKIFNSNDIEMGRLVINENFYSNSNLFFCVGKYEGVIERNTEKIFSFLCQNKKLKLSNLRDYEQEYNKEFDQKRIYDIYSAFEIESSKIYRKKKIGKIQQEIKNKIINFSKNIREYNSNRDFIDGLINDRIINYGIGYGHKERLKKSVQNYIKMMPNRARFYKLNENINQIVDTVYKLRTAIIHDDFMEELNLQENNYLEYFEWIVYAMQLKRIGISNEDIEEFLDLTFFVG